MSKKTTDDRTSRNRATRHGDMLRLELEARDFDRDGPFLVDRLEEARTVAVFLQEGSADTPAQMAAAAGRIIEHAVADTEDFLNFLVRLSASGEERHARRALQPPA